MGGKRDLSDGVQRTVRKFGRQITEYRCEKFRLESDSGMKAATVNLVRTIRRTAIYWRLWSNLLPTLRFFMDRKRYLSDEARRVVGELDLNGIAVTSADKLLDDDLVLELGQAAAKLLAQRAEDILKMKEMADIDFSIGQKTFNLELLGSEIEFDPESVFARVALSEPFLHIANAYLRMTAKLRYYNVWITAASSGRARESQLWHFDREDNYILKAFFYLDDVDEGTGPFTYALATHRCGAHRSIKPEYDLEGGVRRTTDKQMAAVYPRERWRIGTGKKWTIVFADTRGYHKGGEARTKERLMFTCMFTSPASESKELLKIPADLERSKLSCLQQRALGLR